jgi:prophage regulatory protein
LKLTDRFLRAADVHQVTGILGPNTLRRMEESGCFPRRVSIGARAVGWLESEIQEWMRARAAERDDFAAREAAKARRNPNAWIDAALKASAQR